MPKKWSICCYLPNKNICKFPIRKAHCLQMYASIMLKIEICLIFVNVHSYSDVTTINHTNYIWKLLPFLSMKLLRYRVIFILLRPLDNFLTLIIQQLHDVRCCLHVTLFAETKYTSTLPVRQLRSKEKQCHPKSFVRMNLYPSTLVYTCHWIQKCC